MLNKNGLTMLRIGVLSPARYGFVRQRQHMATRWSYSTSASSNNGDAVASKDSKNQETSIEKDSDPSSSATPKLTDEPQEITKDFELPQPDFKRYYHYFDTHKMYSTLKYSGFNEGQADVLMLTIRDMLSRKLAECKENHPLVSQADNDAYLFDAACSEIRNEIQTTRQAQNEQYRASQARLQRDVEIIQQEVNEMINSMRTEIEMESNERKNSTKAEESRIDMKIQELNNKINIDLNSEVKSNIEALRWQTTRRGLIAVLMVAFGIMMATSATTQKKDTKPKPRGPVQTGEEFQVPILTISEVDDVPVEDPPIERL